MSLSLPAAEERKRRIQAEDRLRQLEAEARMVVEAWCDEEAPDVIEARMVRLAAVLAAGQKVNVPAHYPPSPPLIVKRVVKAPGPGLRCYVLIVNGKTLNRMWCEILADPREEKVL